MFSQETVWESTSSLDQKSRKGIQVSELVEVNLSRVEFNGNEIKLTSSMFAGSNSNAIAVAEKELWRSIE